MHSWMGDPFICSLVVTKAQGEGPRERPQIGATAGLGRWRAELCFTEVVIANSTCPCHVSACFSLIRDAEEVTCIADEQTL